MKKQIGIERAFPPRQIVETKQTALGCRAITQVRALTVAGQLYVNYAHNIQWNESTCTAEIYVGREWIPLTRIGLELWATEEGLNILNADGTVTLCVDALPADEQDTPILPMKALGGGGGDGEPNISVGSTHGKFELFVLGNDSFMVTYPDGQSLNAEQLESLCDEFDEFRAGVIDALYCVEHPDECEDEDGAE